MFRNKTHLVYQFSCPSSHDQRQLIYSDVRIRGNDQVMKIEAHSAKARNRIYFPQCPASVCQLVGQTLLGKLQLYVGKVSCYTHGEANIVIYLLGVCNLTYNTLYQVLHHSHRIAIDAVWGTYPEKNLLLLLLVRPSPTNRSSTPNLPVCHLRGQFCCVVCSCISLHGVYKCGPRFASTIYDNLQGHLGV